MSSQANYYRVRVQPGDDVPEIELLCKMRSLLRKKGAYVLVGDHVRVMNVDWRDARALVSDVLPRTTEIRDPKAANVDHFALVFALADPPFEAFQATRFLVAAESVGIGCSLVLNKSDLVPAAEVRAQVERVRAWGYEAVPVSVESGAGMEGLRALLRGRTTVLAGPSGVGKSSIINQLRAGAFDDKQRARLGTFQRRMETEHDWRLVDSDGEASGDEAGGGPDDVGDDADGGEGQAAEDFVVGAHAAAGEVAGPSGYAHASAQAAWKRNSGDIYGAQAVGNVGYKSRRGRHTTRSAVLLDMPGGGLLVDTPGFNYPAMHQVTPGNVASYFPEIGMLTRKRHCQFGDCTHTHEPGCVVRNIWERYEFYVRVLEEVTERVEVENTKLQMQKRRRQGMTKQKKGKGGEILELARLDAKKHRRTSRTAKKVQVRDLAAVDLGDGT